VILGWMSFIVSSDNSNHESLYKFLSFQEKLLDEYSDLLA
jgi:hypothetical protein